MAQQRLLVADYRVQALERTGGWRSFTILSPSGAVHAEADQFLVTFDGSGTQRTYAHYLVDHIRIWATAFRASDLAKTTDIDAALDIA